MSKKITKMKNLSIDQILAHTQDAILASGKKFHELPKEAIEGFLKEMGLSMDQAKKVYNHLKGEYNDTKTTKEKDHDKFTSPVSTPVHTPTVDHYTEKIKNPRKSVFGEIKKIA
jgi:hypothetical protein